MALNSNRIKARFIKVMVADDMRKKGVPHDLINSFNEAMDGYLNHGVLRTSDRRLNGLLQHISTILRDDPYEPVLYEDFEAPVNDLVIKAVNAANGGRVMAGRRRNRRGRYYYYPYAGWYNWWYGIPNYWNGWYWSTRPYYLNYGWNVVG